MALLVEGECRLRMMGGITPWALTLPYVASFGAMLLLALVIAGQRSKSPAVPPFLVWVAAAAAESLGYVLELRAPDLASKLFWDNVQWLPMPLLLYGVVAFSFHYAGNAKLARRAGRAALVSTGVSVLAVLGAASFGTLRESARIEPSSDAPALLYEFSGLDYLASVVMYGWLVIALVRLWSAGAAQPLDYRRQALLVSLGVTVPAALGLLAFTPIRILGQRDVMPLAFTLGGVFVFWGIHRHHLFDLVPVARFTVLDAIRDAVLVLDRSERVVDANAAARALTPRDDLVGTTLEQILPQLSTAELGAEPSGGRVVRVGERALVASLVPVPDESGREVARAIVLRDVTELERLNSELERRVESRTLELVRTAEHLRQSEAKLRAVFNGTGTLIGLLDVDGKLLAANRVALELSGASEEEVLGRPFADGPWWTHDAAQRTRLQDALSRARAGAAQHFETTHLDSAGEVRTIDFHVTPYRDASGGVSWLIPEGRDITELKNAERQRAVLARRLEQGERLEALGRLASGVAHDFNNLLSVIGCNAELLLDDLPSGSPLLDLVKDIQKAATSAGTLTRQLLAFSKEQKQEEQALEVDAQLEALSRLLGRVIGSGVAFSVAPGARGRWAHVGRGQFEQIVINLAVNASQALGGRGSLRISTAVVRHEQTPEDAICPLPAPGSYVVIRVEDDGPGIDPEIQAQIFEPFFTTKEHGTGLGLATVYALTKRAGGFVTLRSAVGAGTTLGIHLPEIEAKGKGAGPREAPLPLHVRVLLVDDNPLVRTSLERVLRRLGCTVISADGPDAALRLLAEGAPFELMITDVAMPGQSGAELAQQVRRRRPTLPILFISANPPQADLEPWLSRRDARYLQKPILLEALHATITELA